MLLAFLLALQTASAREAPPVLQFPTPGLDDSAAYEGYTARIYRDSRGNSVEIYIEGKTGRVVHLWADGLNESVGFTAREEGGQKTTAAVAFDAGKATVGATGGRRCGCICRRWRTWRCCSRRWSWTCTSKRAFSSQIANACPIAGA